MPSTYSPDLRIELIANGEQSGTWGSTTNNNLGTLIEDAISGTAYVTVTTNKQALTAINGVVDQARCSSLVLSATTGVNFDVYVPPTTKLYVVTNGSAYTATLYCSTVLGNTTAAGTGISIPAGKSVLLRADSVNVVGQFNQVVGNLSVGGNVAVTGNTTLAGTLEVTGTTTLTGEAIAPTVIAGDITSKIATTAFVDTAVSDADYMDDPNVNGIMVRTADKTATPRSIAPGTGISVADGNGVAGNPRITNTGVITFNGVGGAITYNDTNVLAAVAGASAGGVGTYAMLGRGSATNSFGSTIAGSGLYPSGTWKGSSEGTNNSPADNNGDAWMGAQSAPQAGTWRCMGRLRSSGWSITLWLRII